MRHKLVEMLNWEHTLILKPGLKSGLWLPLILCPHVARDEGDRRWNGSTKAQWLWSFLNTVESLLGIPVWSISIYQLSALFFSPNHLFQLLKVEKGLWLCPHKPIPITGSNIIILFMQAVAHLLKSNPKAGAFGGWSWEKFGIKDVSVYKHNLLTL